MNLLKRSTSGIFLALLSFAILGSSACQPGANTDTTASNTTTNANANTASTANANASPATPITADFGPSIEAREPDNYRATVVLTAQTTGGERAVAIPEFATEVARNGADRRIAFKLPSGEQLVYLDRADKRYIISVNRKQFAELTPQSTGFEVPRMMTPGQLVGQLQKQRGYERIGEEEINGRAAIKYRYASTAKTGTQAGDVQAETLVFVDKETGLPLRSELFSEASGNVQGVKGLRVVAEMRDLQTGVEPSFFEVPQGFAQVAPEQVRQQVDAVIQAATAVIGSMMSNMNTPGGTTTTTVTTTTTTPTPAAAASPSPQP